MRVDMDLGCDFGGLYYANEEGGLEVPNELWNAYQQAKNLVEHVEDLITEYVNATQPST